MIKRTLPTILAIFCIAFSGSLLAQEKEKDKEVLASKSFYKPYDGDLLSKEFHAGRRQALRDLMPVNTVAVLFASPVRNRANDIDYEYHQDPNFYYLTGLMEPHAMIVIFKEEAKIGREKVTELLFVQQRNADLEAWTGKRLGTAGARELLGIDHVYTGKEWPEFQIDFSKYDNVYHLKDKGDIRDDKKNKGDLASLRNHFKIKTDTLSNKPNSFQLNEWMARLRQNKLDEELKLMRQAIDITCFAQTELMKAFNEKMTEYQSEAIVEYCFKNYGAEYPGFPSILGAGENSCILHYTTNRKPIENSDLLVSDIGAEYHGYTADVTRTIPADGNYSTEEAAIYNLVLKAQNAGIAACKKGNKFWAPHNAATEVIKDGLLALGIITKSADVANYFMHGTSHYLGLDVHDAGLYGALKPGEVITVEPGIYISEGSDCDPKWWNIGVRIEDDILITTGEPENLSGCVPRTIEEIEAIMKQESLFNKFED
jgi:Xaa-Pro aminopeptidase